MDALEFLTVGRKTISAYAALCAPVCKKHGINNTCLDVLMFLHNFPEYNTARDLCQVRGIKTGMASVAVDTLMCRGLLEAVDDAADRRVKRLRITPAADEIIKDGAQAQLRFADLLGSCVSESDREALRRIVGKVQATLDEWNKNGCID